MRHCGTNRTELDVREDHVSICLLGFHISWNARSGWTCATFCTWITGVHRIGGIKPQHVGIVIIPQGHHKNNTCIDGLLNGTETTLLLEICAVLRLGHPIFAVIVCDGIVLVAIDRVGRMFNGFAILSVELLHFLELASVRAICGDNCVVTVIGFVESTWKSDPGPKNFSFPNRCDCKSHPFLSHRPLKRSGPLSPQSVPLQRVWTPGLHACMV